VAAMGTALKTALVMMMLLGFLNWLPGQGDPQKPQKLQPPDPALTKLLTADQKAKIMDVVKSYKIKIDKFEAQLEQLNRDTANLKSNKQRIDEIQAQSDQLKQDVFTETFKMIRDATDKAAKGKAEKSDAAVKANSKSDKSDKAEKNK
jgi:hypothetical protein